MFVPFLNIFGLPAATLAMYIVDSIWIYWYLHRTNVPIFNLGYFLKLTKIIFIFFILFIILYKGVNFVNDLNLNYFYSLFYGSLLYGIIYLGSLRILYKKNILQIQAD